MRPSVSIAAATVGSAAARLIALASLSLLGPGRALGADLPKSLSQTLQEEIGKGGSVVILGSSDGLVALSPDGKRRRTLVPGRVFGVFVDNRSEVIWYRSEGSAATSDQNLIDLRASEPAPVRIISGLALTENPDIAYEKPAEISPPGRAVDILLLTESGAVFQRRVDACGMKKRHGCPRYERVPCESTPKGAKCLTLDPAALPVLKKLAERAVGRSLFLPPQDTNVSERIDVGRSTCRRCGLATGIPGTNYRSVLTEVAGDVCHIVAQVFDPKTSQFIDIESGRRSPNPFGDLDAAFGNAWISGTGDAFVETGAAHTFTTGKLKWKGPYEGGGFLGGGWWVPGSDYPCQ